MGDPVVPLRQLWPRSSEDLGLGFRIFRIRAIRSRFGFKGCGFMSLRCLDLLGGLQGVAQFNP